MKWEKTAKAVTFEGTTIFYNLVGTDVSISIESRNRKIPHAGRSGYWTKTFYYVIKDGKEVMKKYSLKDAKEYAESLIEEGGTI